jgi:hypothetical protein
MTEIASQRHDVIFETNQVGETLIEGIDGERTFFELIRYVMDQHTWFSDILRTADTEGLESESYHEELIQFFQAKYDFLSFLMTLWRMNTIGLKVRNKPTEVELLMCAELLPEDGTVVTQRSLIEGPAGTARTDPVDSPLNLDGMLTLLGVEIEFLMQKGDLIPVRLDDERQGEKS